MRGPFAADPSRYERGRRLAREHEGEIRLVGPFTWSVPASGGGEHTVKPHHGICTCGDATHRDVIC